MQWDSNLVVKIHCPILDRQHWNAHLIVSELSHLAPREQWVLQLVRFFFTRLLLVLYYFFEAHFYVRKKSGCHWHTTLIVSNYYSYLHHVLNTALLHFYKNCFIEDRSIKGPLQWSVGFERPAGDWMGLSFDSRNNFFWDPDVRNLVIVNTVRIFSKLRKIEL